MTLQEFENKGGCKGCYFYRTIEPGRKECTFEWFNDGSDDWSYGKNCDDMEGNIEEH